jgi:cobalt-zinc-cadmium efflux system outer membrane protein
LLATQARAEKSAQVEAGPASLTLGELEQMALAKNPTLPLADAALRSAAGRALQAGFYPNPIMGYLGEELSLRAPSKTSEHLFFMEQAIVTAGKLKHSRSVSAQEQKETEADAEAQKHRVLNAVRMLYYEALGAQQMLELRTLLAEIARGADTTSQQLFNVGAADRPDVLEAQIELDQSEIELIEAENDLGRAWLMLAAVVGEPTLKRPQLQGDLEGKWPVFERDALLADLLQASPELKRAQAGVERARAMLQRAKAEPVPDILLRGGIGYNNEFSEFLGEVGPEAFIEVGFRVPLFDRNQGNIASAQAEIDRAGHEVRRLELELRTRMAMAYDQYSDAFALAERYQTKVLPRAQEAYELYLGRFREMGAAYPQVLIAQRTLFQVRADYVESLVDLWQNAVLIRGMLLAGGLEPALSAAPIRATEGAPGHPKE